MKRVRLVVKDVLGVLNGEGVALMILTDEEEMRQISVVCDKTVAQQAELRIRGLQDTHAFMAEALCDYIRQISAKPMEILIHGVASGQYQAVLSSKDLEYPVPIRASDAVLLSMAADIPIYMDEKLMARQSVAYHAGDTGVALPVNILSRDMLQRALDQAVEDENYELASHLRDEMNKREENATNNKD